MQRNKIIAATCGILAVASPAVAAAADLTILVAPKGNPAEATAAKLADGVSVVAEAKLFKALDRAAAHLTDCGKCTVTIKVAGGVHTGKAGIGQWSLPEVAAPQARLHVLGGWDADFAKRAPFTGPSVLAVTKGRSGTILNFGGSALAELYLSGFAMDAAPSNNYDKQTNSLLQGYSPERMLSFGALTTDRLVVADNVFVNNAWTLAFTGVRPASDAARVEVRNNYFLNNIRPWEIPSNYNKYSLARYVIEGNSFIVNWPINPDVHTSNPGALDIGNRYAARKVEIRRNLFAYNFGGAIFISDELQSPALSIRDNLFWGNGQMYEPQDPGDGAVVGKFNGSWRHGIYSAAAVADDFSWDTRGNVVLDPGLGIPVLKLTAIGQERPTKPANTEPTLADMFDDPTDYSFDTNLDAAEFIENFAPRMPFNLAALPVPKNPKARAYGASAARVACPACANLQLKVKAVNK